MDTFDTEDAEKVDHIGLLMAGISSNSITG
jgi:hypothetical protein